MAAIYFLKDYKNEELNKEIKAGSIRNIFPGSELYNDVLSSGAVELMDYLPITFPGVKHLVKAGINSYQKLKQVKDLTTVPGIGEKTAEEIQQFLTENKK